MSHHSSSSSHVSTYRGATGSPLPRLLLVLGVVCALVFSGQAVAGQRHLAVVRENPADHTPHLVASAAVADPHVDAIAVVGDTVVAGGRFDQVKAVSGTVYNQKNLFAFDRTTGAINTNFDPVLVGGQVWAAVADPATNSVYVGGEFDTVDGLSRPSLVKLNATTGAVDTSFDAKVNGRILDLKIATLGGVKRLVVAGNFGAKLFTVNLSTGSKTANYFSSISITDPIPNAWGGVAVYSIAIDPSGTRLVATGNFRQVDGQGRTRLFLLNLGASPLLASWYYPGFAKPCGSTNSRRIAYLQGVDWSPSDSRLFNVVATGQIPASTSDIWYQRLGANNKANTTVCDAVGRFSVDDPTKPVWINYTGGDSVWEVEDTGVAVYVSGHFRWLDNPDGYASKNIGDSTSGRLATRHQGIGAIDPVTGLANAWGPQLQGVNIGGKALVSASDGLWVGNDSPSWNQEPRSGIALAPLP